MQLKRGNHFWGEAVAKAMPLSTLAFRALRPAARSSFSFPVIPPRGLMAFSAPLG